MTTPPLKCRHTPACLTPATYAEKQDHPWPSLAAGWVPLCWSHAVEAAIHAGHPTARHMVTLTSIGYALEHELQLIEYVKDRGYVPIPLGGHPTGTPEHHALSATRCVCGAAL